MAIKFSVRRLTIEFKVITSSEYPLLAFINYLNKLFNTIVKKLKFGRLKPICGYNL